MKLIFEAGLSWWWVARMVFIAFRVSNPSFDPRFVLEKMIEIVQNFGHLLCYSLITTLVVLQYSARVVDNSH